MKKPITIGDQKFIWSDERKAWIDEKTGVLANQGLQSLLEVSASSTFHNAHNENPPAQPITPQETKKKEEKIKPEPTSQDKPSYNGEPVNIGGQKFILDDKKGWIDSKTKQPPSKDVIKLLDKITGVKSLVDVVDKIEIEPITIGGEKYTWDAKAGEWINAKTKQKADKALQKLLTTTINKAGIAKLDEVNPAALGVVGEAAKQKVKTDKAPKPPSAIQTSPVVNKETKSLLINMIKKLKSIDESFKLKSEIIAKQNAKDYAEARENIIEQQNNQAEALNDASKIGGPSIGRSLGIAAIIGIIALAFQPVKESLKTAYEYIKSAYDTTNWIFDTISAGFEKLLGLGKKNTEAKPQATSAEKPYAATSVSPPITKSAPAQQPAATPVSSSGSESPLSNTAIAATKSSPVLIRVSSGGEYSPRRGWYKGSGTPVSNAKTIVQQMFPNARITSHTRKAGKAGKAGGKSWHVKSGAAVDIAPIKGMSFDQWLQYFRNAGYTIIEAIDETIPANRKITGGTGPHWHVVLGKGGTPNRVNEPSRPGAGETYQQPDNSTDYVQQTIESKTPYEALLNVVKGAAQTLRIVGKTDSYYIGNLEEIAAKKTSRIAEISAKKYADMVQNNTITEEDLKPMVMELPNINQNGGSTVQTPSTSNDKKVVGQYLQYFGFNTKILNY